MKFEAKPEPKREKRESLFSKAKSTVENALLERKKRSLEKQIDTILSSELVSFMGRYDHNKRETATIFKNQNCRYKFMNYLRAKGDLERTKQRLEENTNLSIDDLDNMKEEIRIGKGTIATAYIEFVSSLSPEYQPKKDLLPFRKLKK